MVYQNKSARRMSYHSAEQTAALKGNYEVIVDMGKSIFEVIFNNMVLGFFKETKIVDKQVLYKAKCRLIPNHFIIHLP